MSRPEPRPEIVFRDALRHVVRSVDALYRAADRQCCTHPAVADHLRKLADLVAAEALESLRTWPA